MDFRARLFATLRAIRDVCTVPGVLVIGSEVPNLIEPGAASTLVVSMDVDIGVPVELHAAVRERLVMIRGLHQSIDEPSVWLPDGPDLIEVNFVGMDGTILYPSQTYVLDDTDLPLLVLGPLGLLEPGVFVRVDDWKVQVPSTASLLLEKLGTDRDAIKGARDLLVVAGLLRVASPTDEERFVHLYEKLPDDFRYAVRSNLTVLSLMDPLPGMPDPRPLRARVAALLARIEATDEGVP